MPADSHGPGRGGRRDVRRLVAGLDAGGNPIDPTNPPKPQPPGGGADGKSIFASAGCGGCHTLADAGSDGNVGPNLDDSKPSKELAVDRITNGQGGMPSFASKLSEAQIEAVAAYVAENARPVIPLRGIT